MHSEQSRATLWAPPSVLQITLVDRPGALARVIAVFSRRGCRYDEVLLLPSEDGRTNRLWIGVRDSARLAQMTRFITALEDVESVCTSSIGSVCELGRVPDGR